VKLSVRVYSLRQIKETFYLLFKRQDVREWVQAQIENGRDSLFFVIGYMTAFLEGTDQAQHRDSSEEYIFGINYRKVKFKWFRSGDVDAAFITPDNLWKMFAGDRGTDDDDSEVVEADLKVMDGNEGQNGIFVADYGGGEHSYVPEEGTTEKLTPKARDSCSAFLDFETQLGRAAGKGNLDKVRALLQESLNLSRVIGEKDLIMPREAVSDSNEDVELQNR
jgi:hypothetical protein